ncbi:hypothetical protein AKO1_006580 [Acrasis kona]|uniref:Peptidase A1 domain-containing protein n=1 Tax=Acrasis kona TaxID=1008807 RepID=A0AAW2ZNG6_9EUKA
MFFDTGTSVFLLSNPGLESESLSSFMADENHWTISKLHCFLVIVTTIVKYSINDTYDGGLLIEQDSLLTRMTSDLINNGTYVCTILKIYLQNISGT